MRRILPVTKKTIQITLLSIALLMTVIAFLAVPARAPATPGPDQDPPRSFFTLIFFNLDTGELLNELNFQRSTGWDFGDRGGYLCAWVEHFSGGQRDFDVAFTRYDIAPYMQVNDRFGPESSNDCLDPETGDRQQRNAVSYDGEDHFPHLVHAGDGLTFFRGGQRFEFLDMAVDQCDDTYWVNGDEPGEVILWWDPDGPTFAHGEGEGALPCGGGPDEPFAVIHAQVVNAAAGVTFCTHSQHEDLCSGAAPTTTPAPTTPPPVTTTTPPPPTTSTSTPPPVPTVTETIVVTTTVVETVTATVIPPVVCESGSITLEDGRTIPLC